MRSKKDSYAKALAIMDGSNPDVNVAKALLEEAMDQGDERAMYALATWYHFGKDGVVAIDHKKAARLVKVAAQRGLPEAQFDYAVSLETGLGVKQNEAQALTHYLRAALNGHVSACESVGRMYYHGIGVAKDRRVADVWLKYYDFLQAGKKQPRGLR